VDWLSDPNVAVIVAVPTFLALATPPVVIEAIVLFEVVQVVEFDIS
jgi:hypothetical protein